MINQVTIRKQIKPLNMKSYWFILTRKIM